MWSWHRKHHHPVPNQYSLSNITWVERDVRPIWITTSNYVLNIHLSQMTNCRTTSPLKMRAERVSLIWTIFVAFVQPSLEPVTLKGFNFSWKWVQIMNIYSVGEAVCLTYHHQLTCTDVCHSVFCPPSASATGKEAMVKKKFHPSNMLMCFSPVTSVWLVDM